MHVIFVFIWILLFIVVLLFSITIHEFGHFLALKKMKVYVHEFAIGFGPALYSWGKKETKYTIRALPLGGYVLPASQFSEELFPNEKVPKGRKIEDVSFLKKIIFVLAGIFINIMFALLISLFYFACKDHFKHVNNYGDFLYKCVVGFFKSFAAIFTGNSSGSIINTINDASKTDSTKWGLLFFLILVSINFNLGFFNVIPFPPLDGWKAVEFSYEKISKKNISERARIIATVIGVSILILFTIFVFVSPYIRS